MLILYCFYNECLISQATLSLFDWSGLELNEGTRRSLMQRSQQLHHLCTLIKRSLEVVTTSANRFVCDANSTVDSMSLEP